MQRINLRRQLVLSKTVLAKIGVTAGAFATVGAFGFAGAIAAEDAASLSITREQEILIGVILAVIALLAFGSALMRASSGKAKA
ncbi:MAG: hypothetical protein KJN99_01695, partial [Marinicaulis sp.]|nr:hypothetical protein [Marinicaulis sp.]